MKSKHLKEFDVQFSALTLTAAAGMLVMVEAKNSTTGKKEAIVCARSEGENDTYTLTPLAKMLSLDEIKELERPETISFEDGSQAQCTDVRLVEDDKKGDSSPANVVSSLPDSQEKNDHSDATSSTLSKKSKKLMN